LNDTKRLSVYFPPEVKAALEKMSEETGLAQTQLVVMATHSMLINYQTKGSFIFADLLNPEHKQKG
jgi:hypothetical protein